MFQSPDLLGRLEKLFLSDDERFDELLAASGLDPTIDLIGADLSGADFSGALVNGWDLTRCDLTGASFVGAKIFNLKANDAVGLDLTGATFLDELPQLFDKNENNVNWIFDQISKSGTGAQRGPLIERLLRQHSDDVRVWDFLLNTHLKRERVGKHVSFIISEWERENPSRNNGNSLREHLLEDNGTPYKTVKAKIFRELSSRLGASDRILSIAERLIEREGFWTSGIVAMSVLAKVFPGDERAEKILRNTIQRPDGWSSKSAAASALFDGFNTSSNRRFVEMEILNPGTNIYQRTAMMNVYCTKNRAIAETWRFADKLFGHENEPALRAEVLAARVRFGDLKANESVEIVRQIALTDNEHLVRRAAVGALEKFGSKQVDFLTSVYKNDIDSNVRSTAVEVLARLNFRDTGWFIQVFETDESDVVRSVALEWLLSGDRKIDQIRSSMIAEITRDDPGYTACRAAYLTINRWPNEPYIFTLVSQLVEKLPNQMVGWRSTLRYELKKRR